MREEEELDIFRIGLVAVPVILLFVVGLMFGLPLYGVWTAEQEGKATLAKAESTRQAQIVDAKAKLESAQYIAKAADEVQAKLTPEYIQYLRIQMMSEVGEHNPNAMYFEVAPSVVAPQVKQ